MWSPLNNTYIDEHWSKSKAERIHMFLQIQSTWIKHHRYFHPAAMGFYCSTVSMHWLAGDMQILSVSKWFLCQWGYSIEQHISLLDFDDKQWVIPPGPHCVPGLTKANMLQLWINFVHYLVTINFNEQFQSLTIYGTGNYPVLFNAVCPRNPVSHFINYRTVIWHNYLLI